MVSKTLTKGLTKVKFVRVALLASALFLLPFVAFTGTAKAAISDCPANRLCMWVDTYGNGYRYSLAYNGAGWCTTLPPSMNDVVSSAYNRLSTQVKLFEDANCSHSGESFFMSSGDIRNKMPGGIYLWTFNDEVSSVLFY